MPIIDLRLILLAEQMEQLATGSRNDGVELAFEPNSSVIENSDGTLSPVFDTKKRKKSPIPGAIYFQGPRVSAQVATSPGKLVLQGVWDERAEEAKLFLLTTRMGFNSNAWRTDEGIVLRSPYEALKNLTAGVNGGIVLETTSRSYGRALDGLLDVGINTLNNWNTDIVFQNPPKVGGFNFMIR